MGVEIAGVYRGGLRCEATHGPSGNTLATDAPTDNGGRGASFSPTDLVATALGTCIQTTMALVAERDGVDLTGMEVRIVKEMVSQPFRRIGTLRTTVTMPGGLGLSAKAWAKLQRAAHHCPVHRSLSSDLKAPIDFVWPEGEEPTAA